MFFYRCNHNPCFTWTKFGMVELFHPTVLHEYSYLSMWLTLNANNNVDIPQHMLSLGQRILCLATHITVKKKYQSRSSWYIFEWNEFENIYVRLYFFFAIGVPCFYYTHTHIYIYIYIQVSVMYPFIFSDHMLPFGMFMVHDITFEMYRRMDEGSF